MTAGADIWNWAVGPFSEFAFMRRALVATLALALSAAPLGVFLTLRRMSLLGDALSHAVLPGVAVGFMLFGLSLPAMALGGVAAGLLVAALAGAVSRFTTLKEDASLAAIYLVALALGVSLIAGHGTQLDLLHILFGSALGVDNAGLLLVAGVATASVLALACLYRGLVLESLDPVLINASRGRGWGLWGAWGSWVWHQAFLMLVVVNLVAGFQTLSAPACGTTPCPPNCSMPAHKPQWRAWLDCCGPTTLTAPRAPRSSAAQAPCTSALYCSPQAVGSRAFGPPDTGSLDPNTPQVIFKPS